MEDTLKKAAQTVQTVIYRNELNCRVIEFDSGTRTSVDAANAIGCDIGQIAKSLIFRAASDNPVLVLASGPNRVNESLISSYIGEKVEKANAEFTRSVTGFAIGGIPPIGHHTKINQLFIDEDLLQYEDVWAAAGTPNAVFNIRTPDLIRITEGKVKKIKV